MNQLLLSLAPLRPPLCYTDHQDFTPYTLSSLTTLIPPLLHFSFPPSLSLSLSLSISLSVCVLLTLVNSALKFSANVKVRETDGSFHFACARRRGVSCLLAAPPPSVGISFAKNITRYGNRGRIVPRVSVRRVDEYFEVISSGSVGRWSPPRGQIKEVADA